MAGIGVKKVADCPVCLGTFKDPRVLPCGHTFCLECITEHGRSKGSGPDCPNCRTKFQIPSSGFEGLTKNYCLNSVLDEISSSRVVDVSKTKVTKGSCKKHGGEELVLYCLQCNALICLHCMEDDHQKHDCFSISTYAEEARMLLESYEKSIKTILSQVTSQKAQLQEKCNKFCDLLSETELAINEEYEKKKRLLDENRRALLEDLIYEKQNVATDFKMKTDETELAVNEEYEEYKWLLDDHRRLLLEELSNEKQKVTKDLNTKIEEIEEEQLILESFDTRIEEMLKVADIATTFDIVCQHKDFKDCFDKLNEIQPQAMGQVCVTGIEFISGYFKDFISGRENMIGRLQMESDFAQLDTENVILEQASAADHVGSFTFKTRGGLAVHVSEGDLVDQSLDAIVSPANENLSNEDGVACAIAKAAGYAFQRECDENIRTNGKLEIVSVMHTSAGNLSPRIKHVIHTVSLTKADAKDDKELLALVRLAVLNCINYANEHLKIRSLAIPSISSGIFGAQTEIVGRASFEALTMFDENSDCTAFEKKTVREIHFLSEDAPSFYKMKRIFQSLMAQGGIIDSEQPVHAERHHFDALVMKASSNENVSDDKMTTSAEDAPDETEKRFSPKFTMEQARTAKDRLISELKEKLKRGINTPERTEVLDLYADMCGRQRIETMHHDSCFSNAVAAVLQIDFQSNWDWHRVYRVIRTELNSNEGYYQKFAADADNQWSWAGVKNPLDAFAFKFNYLSEDKEYDPGVWISAAANALKVNIVLVHLPKEEQEPVERNFKPRLSDCDKTVHIAYYWCGRHQFDALVKK